jgi:hypothetical protein
MGIIALPRRPNVGPERISPRHRHDRQNLAAFFAIVRSGYLPKVLGVGFVTRNFALVAKAAL